MPGLRDLGLYAWLALMPLLATHDAALVAMRGRGWDLLSPMLSTIEDVVTAALYVLLVLSPLLAAWGLIRLSRTAGGGALPLTWLALIALLALFEAMGTWRWELPIIILMVLSLPAAVWGSLSRPVRGRPFFGFVLGLLNYLAFPATFKLIVMSLVRGRLPHGWGISDLAGLIAFSAPYALGAALVASWEEDRAGGDRAALGLLLAFFSWLMTIRFTFFTG